MRRAPLLLLAGALSAAAWQHGSSTSVNPALGPMHVAAGEKLFRAQCAGCHGWEATGTGSGPKLNTGNFRYGATDELVFLSITKGVPGTAMPAFQMDGLKVWQIVSYLRSLAAKSGNAQVKGNIESGARLFTEKGCVNCHDAVAHAPDLRQSTAGRSLAEIRSSILDPHAHVPSEYWRVVARLRSGSTAEGTRLNEDTHSIQLRDRSGKLVSLDKAELEDWKLIRESPIPSYKGRLTDAELDDLLAWLLSVRGGSNR